MIVADDRERTPSTDPWSDWKPRWTRKKQGKKTPHDFQEAQAPSETVTVRLSATRQQDTSRRRIVDARLWAAFSPAQQDAALHIAAAYEALGRGLGFTTSDWQRIPSTGGGNASEFHARQIKRYIAWTKECHREKIRHAMIVDILVFGLSLGESDKSRRVRKGTSRQNLLDGLDLYCKINGWRV
ncbi:MAG: hypothetical protein OXT65_11330 [Alphaproteobacteria bacterium]|nr:hypothetical protein [Alphaproteobacteria bacterium]